MSTRTLRGVRIVRFGEFELDLRAGELRKEGQRVRLQEQPFRLLSILLERPGEAVLREEIRKRLWPNDTIVEISHGINAAVLRLREALGETAEDPQYIETLARRGYRFRGEVQIVYRERTETTRAPMRRFETVSNGESAFAATGSLTGRKVSHYVVGERLGGGGMGVVYRAEDLKLGRAVALKFLPPEVAGDPVSLERFEREARAASALNHPNICTIYGVEDCGGQPVIAMELLEGETLEECLSRGALPVEKALSMGIAIASALDAAHRKGVVHRDLKPANIVVTKAGLKVLDFGLAKMDRRTARGTAPPAHVTQEGAILGTPRYMSPEQVQGKEAGPTSDIFSFAAVLYEMLAGRCPFGGPDSSAVMDAILKSEPGPISQTKIPAGLERLLRRCFAKDPEERWQSASDLKSELEWIAASRPTAPAGTRLVLPRIDWRPTRRGAIGAAAVVLLGGAGYVAKVKWWQPAPTRMSINDANISRVGLSPDGNHLAYQAGGYLNVRSLNSSELRVLQGTEGGGVPFWSPDGRSIAFAGGGKLRRVAVDGGPAMTLAEVNTNIAGTWGPNGTILIGLVGDGIFRVADTGGPLRRVTSLDTTRGETRHLLPQFLPDGRRFIFVAGTARAGANMLYAGTLDSPKLVAIAAVDSGASFVPRRSGSSQGYLVYARGRSLMAHAFDSATLKTMAEPVSLADDLVTGNAIGASVAIPDFSVTPTALAYRTVAHSTRTPEGELRTTRPSVAILRWWMK